MDSILLGLVQIAVAWLVVWLCTDRTKPSKAWWPFDYRTTDPVQPTDDGQEVRDAAWHSRRKPKRPWKPSGY